MTNLHLGSNGHEYNNTNYFNIWDGKYFNYFSSSKFTTEIYILYAFKKENLIPR